MRRLGLLFVLLLLPTTLWAYSSLGKPTGFVYDGANLFTAEQKMVLEQNLSQFEATSTNEIAVATIASLGGDTIENFAVKLFEEWGIGKAKQDNGVLLLIARDDRQMRIEVGYGLEGALPDAVSSDIVRNTLAPAFKEGRYYEGVLAALQRIEAATQGEYVPGSAQTASFDWLQVLPVLFVVCVYLASLLARSRSWWAGGVVGAVAAVAMSYFFGFLYTGAVALVLFVPFGLLLDYLVSRTYKQSVLMGSVPPWWAGGRGSSNGGGFGGFGGGSSGGGGASGSW